MNAEIQEILEGVYSSKLSRQTIVPLFLSSPGQAKSKTIAEFAKLKGKKMVKITLSQRMPNEVIGMLMPDAESGKMIIMDSHELSALDDGDILFFDEIFNGTLKQTLDAVLNLLEDRRLPIASASFIKSIPSNSSYLNSLEYVPVIKISQKNVLLSVLARIAVVTTTDVGIEPEKSRIPRFLLAAVISEAP